MRIRIDPDRCQGHGRCFTIAPELVASDELGNGVVLDTGVVAPALEHKAQLIVANCPEGAVSIEED
jgi:ferredoxin